MSYSIAFSPRPSSLAQLNNAIASVDTTNMFFDADLAIASTDATTNPWSIGRSIGRYERVRFVLAEISRIFLQTVSGAEKQEIERFQKLFSSYCTMILNEGCEITSFLSFVECVKKSVEKVAKHFRTSSGSLETNPLLLVTDIDKHAEHGAMAEFTLCHLAQAIPVLMPYQGLCKMIHYAFHSPSELEFVSDLRERQSLIALQNVLLEIADREKWCLYTNENMIALLPRHSSALVHLAKMKEISFQEIRREAILRRLGKPYTANMVDNDEIVELLSTKKEKHVVWSGHGLLANAEGVPSALGFPLERVSDLLNRVENVSLWDCNSCFSLANIRKIMANVHNRNFFIKVNNGLVSPSIAVGGEDMSSIYFFLASKALHKAEAVFQRKIAEIFPLKDGFYPENHPHIILKSSKNIVPLTVAGVVENISVCKGGQPLTVERLYIDEQIVRDPLCLAGKVALLPGLGQPNSRHFLTAITTDQPFSEFIASAFGQYCKGTSLFLITTLRCTDGLYEKVIYFAEDAKVRVLFYKDDAWNSFDTEWVESLNAISADHEAFVIEPYEGDRAEWLQCVVNKTATDDRDAFERFSKVVSEAFGVGITLRERASDKEIVPQVKKSDSRCEHVECDPEEGAFFRALVLEDREQVAALCGDMGLFSIIKALEFCVNRNLSASLYLLIDVIKSSNKDVIGTIKEKTRALTRVAVYAKREKRWDIVDYLRSFYSQRELQKLKNVF